MIIKIHRITNPNRWYSQLLKRTFVAEPSLFGYIVSEGEHAGKFIHRRDAGEYTIPQRHIRLVESPKQVKRAKPSPTIKTPEKGAQTTEIKLSRRKRVKKSLTPEEWLIEQQIKEYAKRKRRAKHG